MALTTLWAVACNAFVGLDGLTGGNPNECWEDCADSGLPTPRKDATPPGDEASVQGEGGAGSEGSEGGKADAQASSATVACGAASCHVGTEACCKDNSNTAGGSCVATGSACAGLAVPCDDTTDCDALGFPGTICCAAGLGSVTEVGCRNVADCDTHSGANKILCAADGAVETCPSGYTKCVQTTALEGYFKCYN